MAVQIPVDTDPAWRSESAPAASEVLHPLQPLTADEIRPSGSPVPLLWAATSPAKVMKTKIVSPATNLLITSLLALFRPRVARKPAGRSPRRHISTKRATRPAYRSPGVKFGADNPMNSSPAFR